MRPKANVLHCAVRINMQSPPAEGNFCYEYGKALKPATVQDHRRHMGYVDKSDCMRNYYSISRQTWKWSKKLFFHLWDLTIPNSFIVLASCGSKLSHQLFRPTLVRDLIQAGEGASMRQGRQALSSSQPKRLDTRHNKHWPLEC
jgi:hypothetical protein